MDLSKAFDTIPHPLLLANLKAYGLSSSACALFADYLSGRTQRVKVGVLAMACSHQRSSTRKRVRADVI